MSLDLTLNNNWSKIIGERWVVQYTQNTPQQDQYKYVPIPPIYAALNSNIILIGVQSNTAEKHWYLGARVSQYVYISPSTTALFIRGVQVSEQKQVGLDKLTLVKFENYNIYPYVLAIEIPYWLEDVYVELWENIT